MSKTKKQKKRKALDTTLLSSEENILIKSLLENLHDMDPSRFVEQIPSPEVARVLLKQLPPEHPKTVSILSAIGEAFGEKRVQKEIKRTLFRLKQKGIPIPEPGHPEKSLTTFTPG